MRKKYAPYILVNTFVCSTQKLSTRFVLWLLGSNGIYMLILLVIGTCMNGRSPLLIPLPGINSPNDLIYEAGLYRRYGRYAQPAGEQSLRLEEIDDKAGTDATALTSPIVASSPSVAIEVNSVINQIRAVL
jgi:hypothetical protein